MRLKILLIALSLLFGSLSCYNGLNEVYDEMNNNLGESGFRVTYNGNGHTNGLVPSDRNYYQQGETVTIKSSYAALSGNLVKIEDTSVSTSKAYYCSEWSDGTNIYQEGDTFVMGTSDAELTAQWTEYTVPAGNLATGPAGGYIIYDQGNYTGGWRYVELAPTDANNGNTSDLASMTAACASYSAGGYTGWYLMSNDEFNYIGSNNLSYSHNNYNLLHRQPCNLRNFF